MNMASLYQGFMMKNMLMMLFLSSFSLSAFASPIFSQWSNPMGAISQVPAGQGNRFVEVATFPFTVASTSSVVVSGTTETFLQSDNVSGRFMGMGGIYRVSFGRWVSPTVRFSSFNAGGAGISSTFVQMPLNVSAIGNNVPAGNYVAIISIYANEGDNFKALRYLPKTIQVQVYPQ
jgi:hypothetical protein